MLRPKIEIFARTDDLASRFAEVLTGQVAYAIEHRSRATVAFSRPSEEIFAVVRARARLPRGRVAVIQADERHATKGSEDRNDVVLRKYLGPMLEDVDYRPVQVLETVKKEAERAEKDLLEVAGRPPVVDFIHLGLGEGGHTASLVPGDPVLEVTDRFVASTKKAKGFVRTTFTYPVIDAARLVVFVVQGAEKAEAVGRVMRGDRDAPAARIENGNVLFLLDQKAASRL